MGESIAEAEQVTLVLKELRHRPELFNEKLFPLLYQVMRRMARKRMNGERGARTIQPTALVHEAYVRLVGSDGQWENRAHFLACAANVMRQILVDYARKRGSAKRGSGAIQVPLDDRANPAELPLDEILAVNEALDRLAEIDPVKAELVKLRFFGGLTVAESAKVVGLSLTTVKEHLRFAQAWIGRRLSATAGR